MTAKKTSAPAVKQITEGALLKRINRALAKEGRRVKTSRPTYDGGNGPYYHSDLGRHYIVDIDRNLLIEPDVDLVDLGRDRLKVMKTWEYIDDEDRPDIITQIGGLADETT